MRYVVTYVHPADLTEKSVEVEADGFTEGERVVHFWRRETRGPDRTVFAITVGRLVHVRVVDRTGAAETGDVLGANAQLTA